ncbi:hypothetical protein ACWEPA_03025 [Streptomyces filamentosus]
MSTYSKNVTRVWTATVGEIVADEGGKIGRVTARFAGLVYLRPLGGGREYYRWPEEVRRLRPSERQAIEEETAEVST